jgi:formamidopyrimidine-DNA glycosylase
MRELPEVETSRRDLDKDVGGRKIKAVEVLGPKKVVGRSASKKAFETALVGRKMLSVARRGVHLLLDVGDEEIVVADLGSVGAFRRAANKVELEPHTPVVITFTQGGQLRLVDSEGDATLGLIAAEDLLTEYPDLANLGFDPVDQPMSWTQFGQDLIQQDKKLKHLLMDPTFVVGIGPVYSDEILHTALLRWDRLPSELITQEIRRLYRAIVETVHNAVKHRGTSLEGQLDVFGEPGGYNEYLEVYGRAGERSRHGRGEVLTARVAGQAHYYCDYQV